MVPLILLLERLASQVGLGANPDVERLTEQMLGPMLTSLPGVLTLGLAAALGEESIFRGALQPRFGLVLTAILFALLHSNYGITLSTVLVFGVGLVLGVLRLRYNTTTSMFSHAIYNITLGMITYLGLLK
jgi:membrane protease YdiL (CAAX protease family)